MVLGKHSFIHLCREEAPQILRSGREEQRSLGLGQEAGQSAQEESAAHGPQGHPDPSFLLFPLHGARPRAPASPHVTGNVFMKY